VIFRVATCKYIYYYRFALHVSYFDSYFLERITHKADNAYARLFHEIIDYANSNEVSPEHAGCDLEFTRRRFPRTRQDDGIVARYTSVRVISMLLPSANSFLRTKTRSLLCVTCSSSRLRSSGVAFDASPISAAKSAQFERKHVTGIGVRVHARRMNSCDAHPAPLSLSSADDRSRVAGSGDCCPEPSENGRAFSLESRPGFPGRTSARVTYRRRP